MFLQMMIRCGRMFSTDNRFFGNLFDLHILSFRGLTVGPPPLPSFYFLSPTREIVKNKKIPQYQYLLNSDKYKRWAKSQQVPVNNDHVTLESPWKGSISSVKPYKILVVGQCLETTGKKLIYEMMWRKSTPFMMTKLYPGQDGIGSGVGFDFKGLPLNLSAIYYEEKQWLQEKSKWSSLCATAHGICFVMDGYGDTEASSKEISYLCDPCIKIPPQTPLLVLSCKPTLSDLQEREKEHEEAAEEEGEKEEEEDVDVDEDESLVEMIPPVLISEKLGLFSELNRNWMVQEVTPTILKGVWEGFDWLVCAVQSVYPGL
eukprot:TRINITY_DN2517_c0_g2_i8.p1 TRINITY_DN2517_c0_g2~~TRINITY_DN2517_c0_g2_i8.p1  ORF type:complete len:316 (+),score=82.12 TRINITY_DN2517_c0_g2_i8:304-1251(+)